MNAGLVASGGVEDAGDEGEGEGQSMTGRAVRGVRRNAGKLGASVAGSSLDPLLSIV